MPTMGVDFETYSAVELRTKGLDNYATDRSTGAHCLAYGFTPDDVKIWKEGEPFPEEIATYLADGGVLTAWNAAFEYNIWNKVCTRRYGWPKLDLESLQCSMAQSYAMSFPGALEKAAQVLGVTEQKDAAGSRVMMELAVLNRSGGFWTRDTAPEKFKRLYEYCKQDVRTELAIRERLLELSEPEKNIWRIDQRINERGICLDAGAIPKAHFLANRGLRDLNVQMRELTGGAVKRCSEVQALLEWIKSRGVEIEKINKSALLEAVSGDLPEEVQAAIELRQRAAKTSTAKLMTMLDRASERDGRVRGGFQYHGASTGRWAHRGVQVGNLPRPRPGTKQKDIEEIITNFDNPTYLEMFHGPLLDAVADSLRGMICAGPGHELIAVDFSAVEARGIAWLAGQESVLDIFRGHGKIYEHAAAGIYGKPMEAVTKDERQIGKVAILALGYGGGVGAFQAMARGYGVKVSDERADQIKVAWRAANRDIVNYWYALDRAAMEAFEYGEVTKAGAPGREVRFKKSGTFLFCKLPSGRVLTYPYPSIQPVETPWGETRRALHAYAVNGVTNKFEEYPLWGGFISENITQAICRDLLAEAIVRLEAAQYPVVMHVHDEVVIEVPEAAPADTLSRIEEIMCVVPAWAKDFPIAAEGWRGKRFRK